MTPWQLGIINLRAAIPPGATLLAGVRRRDYNAPMELSDRIAVLEEFLLRKGEPVRLKDVIAQTGLNYFRTHEAAEMSERVKVHRDEVSRRTYLSFVA